MEEKVKEKIQDIIRKAGKLGWFESNPAGYPKMQASEVEKCLLAVLDEKYMKQVNQWIAEKELVLERLKQVPDDARLCNA